MAAPSACCRLRRAQRWFRESRDGLSRLLTAPGVLERPIRRSKATPRTSGFGIPETSIGKAARI